MPPTPEDDVSSLEKARERLYEPDAPLDLRPTPLARVERTVPHAWENTPLRHIPRLGRHHVRFATLFLIVALAFFVLSLGAAGYFFYYGGNSVSVDKVSIDLQGPTTIAGGDTVPLSLTITNKNPVALQNATIEIDFPAGTLSADGTLSPDPRYIENIGTIESGATVTRSIKAIIFGGQGQALVLPTTFSYGTEGSSSSTFQKKSSYSLAISSTPLSVSVDTLSETVSGQPVTFNLTVRSNASLALSNVVLAAILPFGFTETSSSQPLSGSTFYIGTLQPGATKNLTLTGTLTGEDSETRVFHFSVGTAKSAGDPTLAVSYMTQDASISIAAPFITTSLAVNGDASPNAVITPGNHQSVVVSYANTLATAVTNAAISITVSGSAVDYTSIRSTNGFYDSTTHSILFSKDTDPSLAQMAPNASGVGAFTFSTLPSSSVLGPSVTFTTSVSGTRVGELNVPQNITSSQSETIKVATVASLGALALHSSGPISNGGPVPPKSGQPTLYTVQWGVDNSGSPLAGGTVSATLPSYVTYTGKTARGSGTFSYDDASRTVTWTTGDLAQGATAVGDFQVSLTPSTSQKGGAPALTSSASFSGYDRFAGVPVNATADAVTTETKQDPGYVSTNAVVQ